MYKYEHVLKMKKKHYQIFQFRSHHLSTPEFLKRFFYNACI